MGRHLPGKSAFLVCKRILLTGPGSSICRELRALISNDWEVVEWPRDRSDLSDLDGINDLADLVRSCDRLVLAHGVVTPAEYKQMSEKDILYSMKVNLLSVVRIVEIALGNPVVRIVVLGSESGVKGSHDIVYALAKAALHKYVEERRILAPGQQLVCVAPSTILDSRMTQRRRDQENVARSVAANPKRRGLASVEVAQMIHHLLFADQGYTSNTVIHMNGGKFARM